MRDIYIVGTGEHPWGKFDDKVFTQLGEVAVAAALKDARYRMETDPGHYVRHLDLRR